MPTKPPERIGLLAGWGDFPIEVARTLKRQNYHVHCLGIKGHASPELGEICDDFQEFGLGKIGGQLRYMRRSGISKATMAGKIFKTLLYYRFNAIRHFPDLTFWRYFYPVFVTRSKDRRDDTLLTMVTDLFGSQGIEFLPATDFAPELLVKEGSLTKSQPNSAQWKDIRFGWQMAKEMGRLDVGQTVVVKDQAVVAVEAVEGTDECIRRAGQLCQSGGFVVIKVAKPKQDMRFDVPTIGVGTIQTIRDSGGRVLAVEANKTIVLDQSATVAAAEKAGIKIVAASEDVLAAASHSWFPNLRCG
jgi:DUF1009 family protein